MPYEFKTTRRIEFSDTDMAGIMHFSHFFRLMESAEHAFLRSLGHSVTLKEFDGHLGLPRVHAACDFRGPLRFEDQVEIHLLVREKRPKSLTYEFRFAKKGDPSQAEVARGAITVVCVKRNADGSFTATHLPERLSAKIQTAPAALFAPPESRPSP